MIPPSPNRGPAPPAGPAARLGLLLPLAFLAHASCSPAYVMHVWSGHRSLLSKQRPIRDILADPATPPGLKAKLSLVEEVRRYGLEAMGMPASRSYTSYVELTRPYVTLTVTACRKTAFEPYEWWFPIVGKVPYKGYFRREGAEREARRLERRGYDAWINGVAAYSTVGWWPDPVLSTMLDGPPHALAETILHEMSHAAVYFRGNGDFNESMATFVGQAGAAAFLAVRHGADSPELGRMREDSETERRRTETVEALYQELARLYATELPDAEKLGRREEVFSRFRPRLGLEEGLPLNNAVVLAHRRYHEDLGDFLAAHERLGRDWRKTLALFKSLDPKAPRAALRRWLAQTAGR